MHRSIPDTGISKRWTVRSVRESMRQRSASAMTPSTVIVGSAMPKRRSRCT
jgi:hypothetical protein